MKNSINYYLAISIPFIILIYLLKSDQIETSMFLISIFTYAFIYRMITDYYRLLSRNAIEKKDFWKLFIPGARIKYFKELYTI